MAILILWSYLHLVSFFLCEHTRKCANSIPLPPTFELLHLDPHKIEPINQSHFENSKILADCLTPDSTTQAASSSSFSSTWNECYLRIVG